MAVCRLKGDKHPLWQSRSPLDCGMKIEKTLNYADLEIDGELPFAKIPPPHKGFSLLVAENAKTPHKIKF